MLSVQIEKKYLVQSSKWRVEIGVWEVVFFPVPEEIVNYFLVYFEIVQISSMYHSLNKRVWFTIIFLSRKESLTLFQIWFFTIPSLILFHLELSRIELPKLNPSILMETVQRLDFLKSLSLS